MEGYLVQQVTLLNRPNKSLDTETPLQEAASPRMLRSGQLQRWASS